MIARLTRDPVLKFLPSNTAVCEIGLASGRKFKTASGEEREETVFVDATVFGKGAEIFNQYMKKGKQVFIEGRLKLDQWDDKASGQKRSKLTVVVENFQFLGGKDGKGGQHESPGVTPVNVKRADRQPAGPEVLDEDGAVFDDSSIPF